MGVRTLKGGKGNVPSHKKNGGKRKAGKLLPLVLAAGLMSPAVSWSKKEPETESLMPKIGQKAKKKRLPKCTRVHNLAKRKILGRVASRADRCRKTCKDPKARKRYNVKYTVSSNGHVLVRAPACIRKGMGKSGYAGKITSPGGIGCEGGFTTGLPRR